MATGQLGRGRAGQGGAAGQGNSAGPAWYIPGGGLYGNKKQTYLVMRG